MVMGVTRGCEAPAGHSTSASARGVFCFLRCAKPPPRSAATHAITAAARHHPVCLGTRSWRCKMFSCRRTFLMSVNDKALDFTLSDQDGNPVSLQNYRGKTVVLYFFPKANTPG